MVSPHIFGLAIQIGLDIARQRAEYPPRCSPLEILRNEVEVVGDFAVDARYEAKRWGIETRTKRTLE